MFYSNGVISTFRISGVFYAKCFLSLESDPIFECFYYYLSDRCEHNGSSSSHACGNNAVFLTTSLISRPCGCRHPDKVSKVVTYFKIDVIIALMMFTS